VIEIGVMIVGFVNIFGHVDYFLDLLDVGLGIVLD
jgi:hypothetical protein